MGSSLQSPVREPHGLVFNHVVTPSGARLRYALCGLQKPNRGTVCLFQGRGEFIEKYFEVIEDLRRRDFSVATLDWRGQGGSSRLLKNPRKGHIKSFAQFDEDLTCFMREVVLPDCPPPFFALSHSMGGNIVLRALPRRSWFHKAVLTAPLVDIHFNDRLRGIARAALRLMKLSGGRRMFLPGTLHHPLDTWGPKAQLLTSDQERFERVVEMVRANPDIGLGGPTIGWICAALDSIDKLKREYHAELKLQTPVLFILAGNDRVADNGQARQLAKRVRNISVVEVRGAQHELLMEQDVFREQVWAAFDSFVEEEKPWRYEEVA